MVTYAATDRFKRDHAQLTTEQQAAFRRVVVRFVEDLSSGHGFRAGLRVRKMADVGDIYEMTWAPDGRATWQYGEQVRAGEPHVIWRRVGTHAIYGQP